MKNKGLKVFLVALSAVVFLTGCTPTDITHDENLFNHENPHWDFSPLQKEKKAERTKKVIVSTKAGAAPASASEKNSSPTELHPSQKKADKIDPQTQTQDFPNPKGLHNWPAFDTKHVREIISGKTPNDLGGSYVFLTFDDGVNPVSTPCILDILDKENIPATFFIVGNTLGEKTAPELKRVYDEGHTVGLHSFTHNYDQLYPGRIANPNEIRKQAEDTLQAMRSILGKNFQAHTWRYPGGHMSWKNMPSGDRALQDLGLEWIDWNAMAGLSEPLSRRPKTVEGILKFVQYSMQFSPSKEVYVVLMHDTRDKLLIPDALPGIIQFFREKGFHFAQLR